MIGKTPGLVSGVCLSVVAAQAEVGADAEEAIKANLAMMEEVRRCAEAPRFHDYGLSMNGPCPGIVDRIQELRSTDLLIYQSGYECTAGEMVNMPLYLLRNDTEMIQWVNDLFEPCDQEFGG